MKRHVIRSLLAVLNSRWLNSSPCLYGFIGNIDAFSYENLRFEESQRPGITVRTILEEADRFRTCPIGNGLRVIMPEGYREADAWDLHDLRNMR